MAEERYYKHDGFERFTHWAHLVDTVILVLSGMQIHYPGFSVFGAMQNARFLHMVSAYLFVAIGVYHTYIFFALGKHRISMPGLLDEDKADFVRAIKDGTRTLEPVDVGHRTVSISQIGLIAMQLGGKLRWDPEQERFPDDNAANARLTRPQQDWRRAYGG